MTPKLFKTSIAEFTPATWDGTNKSGWHPLGDKILIKADEVADKTKGGIQIPDDVRDRMTMAAEAGVVVAVGDGAFQFDASGVPFAGRKPTPGDRVAIGKYSGQVLWGHDGERYRVVSTSEIGAIEHKEPPNVH